MTDYATLKSDLQNLLVDDDGSGNASANFTSILPSMIQYAESRIFQKMNWLVTREQDHGQTFTASNRQITIPTNMIIVEGLAAISPIATNPISGTRNQLERVSLDYIDMAYPIEATTGLPKVFAMLDATTAVVGPSPDTTYKAEFTGIFRPATLSATNTSTYLSANYYQLLLAGCMVFGAGWQKDFGAQADDPKLAQSWEQTYQTLESSAMDEEYRRQGKEPGGNAFPNSPVTAPASPYTQSTKG